MTRHHTSKPALWGVCALAVGSLTLASPTHAEPTPTGPVAASTAVFQTATCTASGQRTTLVTLTNNSAVTQSFTFTADSGTMTPSARMVPAGGSSAVTLTAPANARAIYVTAGGSAAGSLPLTSCSATSAASMSSTWSPTPSPTSAWSRRTSAYPPATSAEDVPAQPSVPTASPMTSAQAEPPVTGSATPTNPSNATSSTSASTAASSTPAASVASSESILPLESPTADSTPSTNRLYVAAGVALAVLGFAVAGVAIRREFKN